MSKRFNRLDVHFGIKKQKTMEKCLLLKILNFICCCCNIFHSMLYFYSSLWNAFWVTDIFIKPNESSRISREKNNNREFYLKKMFHKHAMNHVYLWNIMRCHHHYCLKYSWPVKNNKIKSKLSEMNFLKWKLKETHNK